MALTGTARGAGRNNVAATTVVITPASNFAAGSTAVLVLAYDNLGTGGSDPFSGITDSLGNTWTSRQNALYDPAVINQGVVLRIFTAPMTTPLTTSDTITVAFGILLVIAKSWCLLQVSPAAGGAVVYVTGGVNAGAATGTPTVTATGVAANHMIVGGGGSESNDTWVGDADTTNGSWSTMQHEGGLEGVAGISVIEQNKVVNATGDQTFNPTLTSADCILAWIELRENPIQFALGLPTEADTGRPLSTLRKTYALGRPTEADSAPAATLTVSGGGGGDPISGNAAGRGNRPPIHPRFRGTTARYPNPS